MSGVFNLLLALARKPQRDNNTLRQMELQAIQARRAAVSILAWFYVLRALDAATCVADAWVSP
jgi:hypothetical protein